MNAHRFVVASALGVFLGLGSAQAEPEVYDLAAGPGAVRLLNPNHTDTLEIYIDLGTAISSGTPCDDGDGDELCAADVLFTLDGPGNFSGYMEPPMGEAVVHEPESFPTKVLRLNVLQTSNPPTPPGPQYLGALSVTVYDATGPFPLKVIATGQVIDASGTLVDIASRDIAEALPEPTGIVLLLSGALGLAALHWLRTRGGGVTVTGELQNPR
jgi:hypothetical protein